mmetsp:Transcript_15908/g.29108  ORF Transcript_15908/g.29108 Transcript_15908/m.29108 type:complete len:154 (-) Transcript_15908:505-966(-)
MKDSLRSAVDADTLRGLFTGVCILDLSFCVVRLLNLLVLYSSPFDYPPSYYLASFVAFISSLLVAASAVMGMYSDLHGGLEGLKKYEILKRYEVAFVALWGGVHLYILCNTEKCTAVIAVISWIVRLGWSLVTTKIARSAMQLRMASLLNGIV